MAILIMNIMTGEPNEWRAAIQAELPDLDVRFMPDAGDTSDIRYLAFGKPDFARFSSFETLKNTYFVIRLSGF